MGTGVGTASGGVGTWVGIAVGLGVGVGRGFGVGFTIGVGFGVGLAVGYAVGRAMGVDVCTTCETDGVVVGGTGGRCAAATTRMVKSAHSPKSGATNQYHQGIRVRRGFVGENE